MKRLQIGTDGFALAQGVVEDVVAILGRRGRGKTTTGVVIVEELHKAGARFCVADPTDVWHGLKSSRDGKRPGIPCVVMGGERGDVPLSPDGGEIIADFVADPTSPSCVLELKAFTQGELVRFMTAFLARLYHKNSHPLHLVLDEADQFAPQRPMPGEQAMLGAAQRVTKMGRSKGLHPLLITQRPATLNKNVLTQAGLLVAHAITGPQDRNAVDDWIKANAEEGEREQFLSSLPGLPRGTAWFWSPDVPLFRQVGVRDRETFDSSATPKQGERIQPKALAEVDLEALKVRIAATIEKARAEDPRELRKTIAGLQAELRKRSSTPAPVTPSVTRKVEVPILKDAQVKRLEAAVEKLLAATRALGGEMANVAVQVAQQQGVVVAAAGSISDQIKAALAATRDAQKGPAHVGATASAPAAFAGGGGPAADMKVRGYARAAPVVSRPPANGDARLGSGERKILTAIAQHPEGVTQEQLAVLTGYKRSSRGTYLQRLRAAGLIFYAAEDRIAATEGGIGELGSDFALLPTGDALREHWLGRLPEGERRIFAMVVEAYPRAVTRTAIGEATNYQRSSVGTYLQRLSARRLVRPVGRGEVMAAEGLFG